MRTESISSTWAQDEDVGIGFGELIVDPLLTILVVEEDLEQGIDRADGGKAHHGDHNRAAERQAEADPVGPGEAHESEEIFHNRRMPEIGSAGGILAFP